MKDDPVYRLTRHFFNGLFDLGFLSEEGTEAFERMIIGVCAVFFSFGLLLVRIFMATYRNLRVLETPEPYRQALLGGEAFIMALPMWIVAFVTILIGHALFPDETDFRVLMALPVTERLIFGAKLLALALFTGLFIGATHIALTPLFLSIELGRWAEHAWPLRMAAFAAASFGASAFAVLSVTAVNGLLFLCLPRERLMAASAALRSAMLCALVLALPFVGRLPAQGPRFSGHSAWLYVMPPAWFVGLEQLLLGNPDPFIARLGQLALTALALALLTSAGAYAVLYRHFDRVMVRPAEGRPSGIGRISSWRPRWHGQTAGAYAAIRTFTGITLRRSVLHQGVLVCLSAAGLGLVLNIFMASGLENWIRNGGAAPSAMVNAFIWAPFALIFTISVAVKAALVLPIEQRANWVFRMTEQDANRADELRAAFHAVMKLGVGLPIALVFPLQWLAVGRRAVPALLVAWLCGWLLAEILMKDWARIPFTCSYIPAKRFVPQSLLIGVSSFILFTGIGSVVAGASAAGLRGWPVPTSIIAGSALVLRRARRRKWKEMPLEFEDQLPSEINPLPSLR